MDTIYLNNAASAWPRAPGVVDAVRQLLEQPPGDPSRSGSRVDPQRECRARLAGLLGGVAAERIVLTSNATHALNIAVLGLDLPDGASVVTSVTEHNSVLRPLHHLAARRGIRVVPVGLDDKGNIDQHIWRTILAGGPHVAILNHASNVTGRIQDVRRLFALAHQAGAITVLDASQSLGHIPVDPQILGADLVAFTGHKGLHGPPGTGGLYVDPRIELVQRYVGGTGVRSDLVLHPEEMPMRLEAGTPNLPAIAGLTVALRWIAQRPARFENHLQELRQVLWQGLESTSGVQLFGRGSEVQHTGVISFRLDGWSVADAGFALAESFNLICRTGLHCAPLIHEAIDSAPEGTIRFSLSGFNTMDEIEYAIDAVRRMATTGTVAA